MTSRTQWTDARVGREMRDAVAGVAKAANCGVASMTIDVITPAERAEALRKAFDYKQLAGRVIDQAQAATYRDMAAAELKKAGIA